MKINRKRIHYASFLLDHEATLVNAFRNEEWNEIEHVVRELRQELGRLGEFGIANSRALDNYLQVAMAWLATYLSFLAKEDSFRATVSLYASKLKAILVKPSIVYPGRCRVPQPTISFDENALSLGYKGKIGQTGLTMLYGKIILCQTNTPCSQYIPLESDSSNDRPSKTAICIPLEGDFGELKNAFKIELGSANDKFCRFEKDCNQGLVQLAERLRAEKFDHTVLNVECLTDTMNRKFVRDLFDDENFTSVIEEIVNSLTIYHRDRIVHRALEHTSALLELATNSLNHRFAYRALLREISAACDGADVTLHLRDTFDSTDEDANRLNRERCSFFVTGVGANYRDFLINERIGLERGQIGWALKDDDPNQTTKISNSRLKLPRPLQLEPKEDVVNYIVGEEIKDSIEGKPDSLPYKQLMPNTFLNATVPIYFHDIKMGVINIEWDEAHLRQGLLAAQLGPIPNDLTAESRTVIEEYLSARLPLVHRMADYLSLVIDYFDDVQSLLGRPGRDDLEKPEFIEGLKRESSLRKLLRYHMTLAMERANKLACQTDFDVPTKEQRCLQDLVDGVGYFLTSTSKLRILVSVRRVVRSADGPALETRVYHWIENKYKNQGKDIIVSAHGSVLSTCAHYGVPLFGRIEACETNDELLLRLSNLSKKYLLEAHPPMRTDWDTVPYRPAGDAPRYEVGVPLIFGRRVLGTFDFEQFAQEPTSETPTDLTERGLAAHLEWGRAIAFLIAYVEDAVFKPGAAPEYQLAFQRFQALCAQFVAEVPVPPTQLVGIATDAFGEIIPVGSGQLEVLPIDSESNRLYDLLRFRGDAEMGFSWIVDDAQKPLLNSKSEAGAGRTVTAMMTSFQALIRTLPVDDPVDDRFSHVLHQIIFDLGREQESLFKSTIEADQTVAVLFSFIHDCLSRYLTDQVGETGANRFENRYAWFLHLRKFDPVTGRESFVCDAELPKSETKRSGTKRLVNCNTVEMAEIVNSAFKLAAANKLKVSAALRTVLESRAFEQSSEFINDIIESLPAGTIKEVDVIDALTARLSRPNIVEDDKPSFTQSVAQRKVAIVVPDINSSPFRSARGHGWFWKEKYSVVGIPFMFNGECIAVLNVFRRRDSAIDMKFFRIEERDEAQLLAECVQAILDGLFETVSVGGLKANDLRKELSTLLGSLIQFSTSSAKLVLVQTPFATSRESFEAMEGVLFQGINVASELQSPLRWPDQLNLTFTNQYIVIRISRDSVSELEIIRRFLRLMYEQAHRIYIFVTSPNDLVMPSRELVYAPVVPADQVDTRLLREDPEADALYFRWLMGRALNGSGVKGSMMTRLSEDGLNPVRDEFRKWLRERGGTLENSDVLTAKSNLKNSWHLSRNVFAISRWESDPK